MKILTPEHETSLTKILQFRANMMSISVLSEYQDQAIAKDFQLFELQKMGAMYMLLRTTSHFVPSPKLNGIFIFTILRSDPGRIYCGLAEVWSKSKADKEQLARFRIYGHISISKRADVLYAGELFFHDRNLLRWTNDSGHYRPGEQFADRNLLPHLKLLLPSEKFVPTDLVEVSV